MTLRKRLQAETQDEADSLTFINVEEITPNRFQPRKEFDPSSLDELASSIEEEGLIQPIVVRPIEATEEGKRWEIIAGERRWRAHKLLKRKQIKAIIRFDVKDTDSQISALVENIQREGLNPIEEAEAYRALIVEQGMTQQQVAQKVAKSRAYISQAVRLVKLGTEAKELTATGTLSRNHAYMLAGISDGAKQAKLAHQCVKRQWNLAMLRNQVLRLEEQKEGVEEKRGKAKVTENDLFNYILVRVADGETAGDTVKELANELRNDKQFKVWSGVQAIREAVRVNKTLTADETEQRSVFEE